MEHRQNDLQKVTGTPTGGKTEICASATLSTTRPKRITLGMNPASEMRGRRLIAALWYGL